MKAATVRKSGGQIDDMVMTLIDSAYDKDIEVQNTIRASLINIGKKQPQLLLSSCNFYLASQQKLVQGHKVLLLNVMESVIKDVLNVINEDLAIEIICQSFAEMTFSKEPTKECQPASSDVIVCLHLKFYHEVMNELLDRFQPITIPHYHVVTTLAKLAIANVSGTMPYLKACLSTCLSLMPLIKQDNMKCAFSKMLANFSEAILEHKSTTTSPPTSPTTSSTTTTSSPPTTTSPPPTTTNFSNGKTTIEDSFHEELTTAWEILFNNWMNSKDVKVKCAVIECLGKMSYVIPPKHLQENLTKLVPTVYSLYKKQLDTNVVSEALHHVIDASSNIDPTLIEPYVDTTTNVLFQQIFLPVDLTSSASVKNHNDILKSFSVLAKYFPERVITYVLNKMEVVNEKSRIASLDVMQHLINYSGDNLRDKEKNILSSLKMVTSDVNNKVKRKLAEVIIGISHHGYLELDGGQVLLEFIVKQCILSSVDQINGTPTSKRSEVDLVTNDSLRSFCEGVLYHLSTSTLDTSGILWPYLLTFLTSESFTEACGIICKSIAVVASRKLKSEDPDYYVDFEREVKVPRPSAIFVRLIVLLRHPYKGHERGPNILDALKSLSKLLRSSDPDWLENLELMCPLIESALKESGDVVNGNEMEEKLLELISNCMIEVDGDNWATMCGEDLIKQAPLYINHPQEKNFLLKCIGQSCSRSSKGEFVIGAVDALFNVTQHSLEAEREACAQAIGSSSSSSHAELVLNKLNEINKSLKTSFIVSFFKEAIGDIDEKVKATLILSYGHLALRAPINFLQGHVDTSLVTVVNQNIGQVKDITARNSIIRTIQLIGEAATKHKDSSFISPSSLQCLFTHLKNLMKQESQTTLVNSTRSFILRASYALVNSTCIEANTETNEMFSLMASRVVCLPVDPIPTNSNSTTLSVEDQLKYSKLLSTCLEDLEDFASALLLRNSTPDMFALVFNVLQPMIVSAHDYQRMRSLQIFCRVTQILHNNINVAIVNDMPSLGHIIGTIVPRCSDQSVTVRLMALDCIKVLLKIGLRYEGRSPDFQDDIIDDIDNLKTNIVKVDSVAMFAAISDLSKILNKKINIEHLFPYMEGLLEGLTDLQLHCSTTASLALTNCIKARGSEFHGMVDKVYLSLVRRIPEVKNPQTRLSSLRAIRFLTFHHLLKVVSLLLEEPIPFSDLTREIWKGLGQDPQTMPSIMEHLLDMLSRSQPYEEDCDLKGRDKPIRRALQLPLAITSAMTELMKSDESHVTIHQNYPHLLTQMLAQVASMNLTRSPKTIQSNKKSTWLRSNHVTTTSVSVTPVNIAVEGLKQLLISCKHESLIEAMNFKDVYEIICVNLIEGLTIFASCLVHHQPDHLSKVINCLSPMVASLYPPQRIMAITLFAEFIKNKCNNDLVMVDMLMSSLTSRLVDTDPTVRRLCIRGLGNVASCGQAMVQKYCSTLLPAFTGGLDDKDDMWDVISLEAMEGMSKVLKELKEADVKNVIITVALRIRPCFEKEKPEVRVASLTLFGDLATFGSGENKESFLEQVHSNLVTMVLHLDDSDADVRQASTYSLRNTVPLLGSAKLSEVLLNYSGNEYHAFLKNLSHAISEDLSDRLNYVIMGNLTYFKSYSPKIRASAATFAGCLLGCLPSDKLVLVSKEQSCQALVNLLKDEDNGVRAKAAEAISWLYNI